MQTSPAPPAKSNTNIGIEKQACMHGKKSVLNSITFECLSSELYFSFNLYDNFCDEQLDATV